jgi:hypothetical protein
VLCRYTRSYSPVIPIVNAWFGQSLTVVVTNNINRGLTEADTTNNVVTSAPFVCPILLPDLTPQILEAPAAGATLNAGAPLAVRYRVRNTGPVGVPSRAWSDRLVLRTPGGAVVANLAFASGTPIGSNQYYDRTFTGVVPAYVHRHCNIHSCPSLIANTPRELVTSNVVLQ